MFWKKKLFKNTFREIYQSKSRFISIVLIVFLGCSFYVGLNATGPNMKDTARNYHKTQNLMDLRYRSITGFDEEDLELFSGESKIKDLELTYTQEVIVRSDDQKIVVSAFSYDPNNQINRLVLTEGRYPINDNEILIEDNYKLRSHFSIGDTIHLESGRELPLMMKNLKFEIVGLVRSPQFISYERGFSNIGGGTILSFVSIPVNNFTLPRYTDLVMTLNHDFSDAYSDEYKTWIEETKNEFFSDYLNMKKNDWFVEDRTDLPGYSYFVEDVDKIEKIAGAIPVFFIFIAMLICLTSMTRMVDEERLEVGTLCALGCSKISIVSKYVIYTLLATLLGSVSGGFLGGLLLPDVMYDTYGMNYLLPKLQNEIQWILILIGVTVSVLSILTATLMVSYQLLKVKPSVLMRPKSPILGKKILLERFGFLWNRFSFNLKMTLRNLFRYKKRGFITIIGVVGCATLMLTGFGLHNAITEISKKQFESIFLYDGSLILQSNQLETMVERLKQEKRVESFYMVYQRVVELKTPEKKLEVYMVVLEEDNYSDYIALRNRKTKQDLRLDDEGIIINEGLANKYGFRVGDTIEVSIDGKMKDLMVRGITENYTYNYLYLSKEAYVRAFNLDISSNQVLFTTKPDINTRELKEDLLKYEEVYTVRLTSENYTLFSDNINSIEMVVLVVIVFSAALGLIVVYNLSHINFTERTKELSTFKVLGMTNYEVANYLGRENMVCTVVGIGFGLYLGSVFERYVLSIIETEQVMFVQTIHAISYVYTTLLTLLFTLLVNTMIRNKIGKLDLVGAMKAVD